ncbi:MAG: CerR family C-terminal domain-containing protein [Planctomycetota bacterium]|jgi:AcrR family transcriptional regulator
MAARKGKNGEATRRRLLKAACEIFGTVGYRDARVADICRRARANVAAVNYHFRSKANLYVEAWRHAFRTSLEKHPPDGGVRPNAPAERRLRGRIVSIMRRIADPRSHEFEIAHREMAASTGLLKEVVRESIEPMRREFRSIVRELIGRGATAKSVRLCQMSIMAQCFGPLLRQRRGKMSDGLHRPPGADVEALAEHVTRFSLAGIREMRRRGGRRK